MTKTAPFDPADYLSTAEARAEYVTAALETNDPIFIRDALSVVAKSVGMTAVAQQAGITREGLYKALGSSGNPEFGTVISLLPALSIKLAAQPLRAKRRVAVKRVAAKRVKRAKRAKRH